MKIDELLTRSIKKREHFLKDTDAVRLVNGAGDMIPGVTIDQYNKHFVIQIFHPQAIQSIPLIKDYFVRHFDPEYLIIKDRLSSESQYLEQPGVRVIIEKKPSRTVVIEHGLKFEVDLNDTVNVGLFLDMRRNRTRVAQLSRGKSVLNCFAYTCSFGVYCRNMGALRVVNLDISAKALGRGEKNYQLNELAPSAEEFVKVNCRDYLARAVKKKNYFDIIVLDPPSFSRFDNKVFSVKKEFPRLIALALAILNPSGKLFIATNCTDISSAQLKAWVEKEADRHSQRQIKKIIFLGQDADFPKHGPMKESYLEAVLVDFK